MANLEFGTGKTVVVLSIVAACFAVLWPKIFYPMLTSISTKKIESDNTNGCCDVMFETDVNAFKIMTEMCEKILNRHEEFNQKLSQSIRRGKPDKEIINTCRNEVMNLCGIDIADFLNKKEKLGRSYKQMLDEIRSFNISICLRQNFGVNPGLLGAPRRIRIWGPTNSRHLRQERPLHFRPEMIHPALREKGRGIPLAHIAPKKTFEKNQPTGSLPAPGMRPPMGGAGHVVPPPKVGGTMSVVMPLYTIGIVIFFMYTVMKVFTKKTGGNDELKDFHSDPEFRRMVFSEDCSNGSAGRIGEDGIKSNEKLHQTPQVWKSATGDSTRLGWKERYMIMSAITGLLTEVDQQLNSAGDTQTQYSTELKDKKNIEDPSTEELERDKTIPKVKVEGLEMMAECEGGQKWSRPATPNLGIGGHGRPATSTASIDNPEPQNIYLERALPHQSQLLVSDSKTQAIPVQDGNEPELPVILSSKMTLSLINLNAAVEEEDNRDEQRPPRTQSADAKSEDDNLGTTDSTLLDVDSEVLYESGQIENEPLQVEEYEGMESENSCQLVNEIEGDLSSHYMTATMSGRAEADVEIDLEDTAADISNLDGLGVTEDQEDLQREDVQWFNGIGRESEVDESRRRNEHHHLED